MKLVFVLGPTASGKTALAVELCERLGGEVVSCDSQQAYRGLDIGTAKPSAVERARVRHHLLDVAEPHEQLDAGGYVALADAAIVELRGRGKVAIVSGGTFLWARALRYGLAPAPPRDAGVRARLEAEASSLGVNLLHDRLATIDPVAAAKIHATDPVRTIRALEVWEVAGVRLSELQARHGFRTPREPDVRLVLDVPRDELDRRIARRTKAMFAGGLLDETARFAKAARSRLSRLIGYREALAHLDGGLGYDEAVALADTATRQYARRQLTWLRAEMDLTPVTPDASPGAVAELVRGLL